MGTKKIKKVANELREIAERNGVRIGIIILEEGHKAAGFSSYENKKDAKYGLEVLREMLIEMGGEE